MTTKVAKLANDDNNYNLYKYYSNMHSQLYKNRIGELMQEKSLSSHEELCSMGLAVESSSNSVDIKEQKVAERPQKAQESENNKQIKETKKEIRRLEKALKKDIEELEVLKSDYENGTNTSKIFSKLSPKQSKIADTTGGISAFALGIPMAALVDTALCAEGVFFIFCGGMAICMAAGYLIGHFAAKGIMKLLNRSNKTPDNLPQLIAEQEKKISKEQNRLEQLKASL